MCKLLALVQVFTDIGAVELLLTAAKDGSRLSSKFACLALELMKQPLPDYQCWNVCQWTPQQVITHFAYSTAASVCGLIHRWSIGCLTLV